MQKQSNFPLYIAIAIPIIMMVLVGATIYLPSLFAAQPQYDFLYTVNDQRYTYPVSGTAPYYVYEVQNGRLTRQQVTSPNNPKNVTDVPVVPDRGQKLYVYDVKKNASTSISFEEAQKLKLDSDATAPDGFVIQRGGQRENLFSMLFGGSDYNSMYLVKNGTGKKINIGLGNNQYFSPYDFNFLGWLIP